MHNTKAKKIFKNTVRCLHKHLKLYREKKLCKVKREQTGKIFTANGRKKVLNM